MTIPVIPRSEWGARDPKGTNPLVNDSNGWVGHWNGPPVTNQKDIPAYLRGVQNYHMNQKGWLDIAYNYAIDDYSNVYELRGENVRGGATSGTASNGQGWNRSSRSLLFCVGQGQEVGHHALVTARLFMAEHPGTVTAHGDASSTGTACPGPQITEKIRSGFFDIKGAPPMASYEAYEAVVRKMYTDILDFKPDPVGLKYWVEQLQSGARTKDQVEKAMLHIALDNIRDDMEELKEQKQAVSVDAVIDELITRLQ